MVADNDGVVRGAAGRPGTLRGRRRQDPRPQVGWLGKFGARYRGGSAARPTGPTVQKRRHGEASTWGRNLWLPPFRAARGARAPLSRPAAVRARGPARARPPPGGRKGRRCPPPPPPPPDPAWPSLERPLAEVAGGPPAAAASPARAVRSVPGQQLGPRVPADTMGFIPQGGLGLRFPPRVSDSCHTPARPRVNGNSLSLCRWLSGHRHPRWG